MMARMAKRAIGWGYCGAARFVLLAAGPSLVASSAFAESTDEERSSEWKIRPVLGIVVQGELRGHPLDRVSIPPSDADVSVGGWERIRLGAEIEKPTFRARVSVQDARALGASDANGFAPYDGFVEFRTRAADPSFVRVGRQTARLSGGYLVGNAEWRPSGRTFDALRAMWRPAPEWSLDALASFIAPVTPRGPEFGEAKALWSTGDQLYALGGTYRPSEALAIDLYAYARIARSLSAVQAGETQSKFKLGQTTGETYTVSLRASGDADEWNYDAIGALQFGNLGLLGSTRFAGAFAARVTKRFDTAVWSPSAELGGSYATGDDPSTPEFEQFDPLFPEAQKFYGPTELFVWSNLIEGHATASVEPFQNATLSLTYRHVRSAGRGGEWIGGGATRFGAPNLSLDRGHLAELRLTVHPNDDWYVDGGYSLFFLGKATAEIFALRGEGTLRADGHTVLNGLSHFAFLRVGATFEFNRTQDASATQSVTP